MKQNIIDWFVPGRKEVPLQKLILLVIAFILLFDNHSFFSHVAEIYPLTIKNTFFITSLAVLLGSITCLILTLLCNRFTTKFVLITILLLSAAASYFMDTYNIVIDETMIDNIIKTDPSEARDLFSLKLLLYILVLGVIPAVLVYKTRIGYGQGKKAILSRLNFSAISLLLMVSVVFLFSSTYASFFREHKSLRYYANPTYYLYSGGKYASEFFGNQAQELQSIGLDARIKTSDHHRELVILVVGETARADRFSLNGYNKETNPYLKKEKVISFTNFWACGTSTAVSVPCMFSVLDHSHYDKSKALATENLLDVLKHSGVNVLWLDNNSDSKGVALRVPYESYRTPDKNPVCDIECRDEGMLTNLQSYIDAHPQEDIFIVLHQMGNHGPAYYKRYPERFEKFTPTCKTNHLEACTDEQINNTYDNAIVYTDYFLSKAIQLLKTNSNRFETALFYISDHGESLGEHGLYLHGLPDLLAPETQKHVPMIAWFSDNFDLDEVDPVVLGKKRHERFSHDNVFHTILGVLEVNTGVYDSKLDIIEHQHTLQEDGSNRLIAAVDKSLP